MANIDNFIDSPITKKTLKSYVTGFILSIILTILAFAFVTQHLLNNRSLFWFISLLAIIQFLVQAKYFIGLNTSSQGRWNLLSLLFVVLIIAILAGGTLWIMYNLKINMM